MRLVHGAASRFLIPPVEGVLIANYGASGRFYSATSATGIYEWEHHIYDPGTSTPTWALNTRLGKYVNLSGTVGFADNESSGTGVWVAATRYLSGPDAFTGYRWHPGDAVFVYGGTATSGYYEIASKVDGDTIELRDSIAAADQSDIKFRTARAEGPADVCVPPNLMYEGGCVVVDLWGFAGGPGLTTIAGAVADFSTSTTAQVIGPTSTLPVAQLSTAAGFSTYTWNVNDGVVLMNGSVIKGMYPILEKTDTSTMQIGGNPIAANATASSTSWAICKYDDIEFNLYCTDLDGVSNPHNLVEQDSTTYSTKGWRPPVKLFSSAQDWHLRYTVYNNAIRNTTDVGVTVVGELWICSNRHGGSTSTLANDMSQHSQQYYTATGHCNVRDVRDGFRLIPMMRHATSGGLAYWYTLGLQAVVHGPYEAFSDG